MKQILFGLVLMSFLVACSDDSQVTSSGYTYKFLADVEGEEAQPGEWVFVFTDIRIGEDSTIYNSRIDQGQPTPVKIPEADQATRNNLAPVQDVLSFASVGDSIRLVYPVDSFETPPPLLANQRTVNYDMKVTDIKTQQEYEQYVASLRQAQIQQQQQQQQQQAPVDVEEVRQVGVNVLAQLNTIHADYKAGALNDKIVRTASGLGYIMYEPGVAGSSPKPGQRVSAHYIGILADTGAPFDNSFNKGRTYDFNLGQGEVIAAWDEAFPLMNEGGSAVLFIPPHLAYGATGYGSAIPPNSELMFFIYYAN